MLEGKKSDYCVATRNDYLVFMFISLSILKERRLMGKQGFGMEKYIFECTTN